MTWLPIVECELRRAARDPRTYRSRLGAAFVVLLFGGATVWTFNNFGAAFFSGDQVFMALGHLALMYCLFAGVTLASDCVSREKREGTLGLLFLTDLKPRDIVLGKLVAVSLRSAYGLLAAFPVLAITMTFGGVQSGEFWRVTLNLINTLFFSLSVCLLVSTVSRNWRKAGSAASLLLLLFGLGLPGLGELMRIYYVAPDLSITVQMFSPFYAHRMAFGSAVGLRQNYFWSSLLTVHVVALLCLGVACLVLPRAWQDKADGPRSLRWRKRWRQWKLGNAVARRTLRTRMLQINPFYWLAARERFASLNSWSLICAIVTVAACIWRVFNPPLEPVAVVTGLALSTVLKLLIVSSTCQRLAEDKESGALELLVSTPISVQTILRGQWLALRRQYLGSILAMFLIDGVLFWAILPGWFAEPDQAPVVFFAGFLIMFVADFFALGWVGMWTAVRTKLAAHASGPAFARVMLVPFVLMWLTMAGLGLAGFWSHVRGPDARFVFGLWFGIGMLNDLVVSLLARTKLHREFRTMATDRFQPPKPSWSWWTRLWRT